MGMLLILTFLGAAHAASSTSSALPPTQFAFGKDKHYGPKEIEEVIKCVKAIPVKSKKGLVWMEENNGQYDTRIEIRKNDDGTFAVEFKPTLPKDAHAVVYSSTDTC